LGGFKLILGQIIGQTELLITLILRWGTNVDLVVSRIGVDIVVFPKIQPWERFRKNLVPNPLHVLEQNLLPTAIVKFRGPTIGVASDSLSGFKSAVIFQKIRDAGRAK